MLTSRSTEHLNSNGLTTPVDGESSFSSLEGEIAGMRLLHEVGMWQSDGNDLSELLERILPVAIHLVGADFGAIQLVDLKTGALLNETSRGFGPEFARFASRIEPGAPTTCALALARRERVAIENLLNDNILDGTPLGDLYVRKGIRSLQSTPLVTRGGEVLGVLTTHWVRPHKSNEIALRLLDLLARQACDLIERTRAREQLKESEAHLRFLVDSCTQATWEADAQGQVVTELPTWQAFTGQSAEEARGFGWSQAIHPDDREVVVADWQESVRQKEYKLKVFRIRRADGEWRWTRVLGAPLLDSQGEVRKWVGMIIDVTEFKNTEEALRESEERFRVIVQGLAQAVWETDAEGRFKGDSPTWRAYTGQSSEEFQGLEGGWTVVHPDDREYARRRWELALREGSTFKAEFRIRHVSGQWHWTNAIAAPLKDADGKVRKWAGMNVDVTERRDAERALRESEERLRLGIEVAELALLEVDFASETCLLRPEAVRLLGLPLGALVVPRSLIHNLVHPADQEEFHRCKRQALDPSGDGRFSLELRMVRPDGSVRWCSMSVRVFFTQSGSTSIPSRGVMVLLDITERKMAERNMEELNATLERRVSDRTERLRKLAIDLSGVEHRERKRLAAILHDGLQQLLVAVGMNLRLAAQLVRGGPADEPLAETESLLRQAVDLSRDLTTQLRPPVLYEDGLVPALHWLATRMGDRHRLVVEVIGDPNSGIRLGDGLKALAFECVNELLFNVTKHSGINQATVEVREDLDWLRLAVTDQGRGLKVEEALKIEAGGGFGLFSIRERLAPQGGSMVIDSEIGEGTRIELSIPLPPAQPTEVCEIVTQTPDEAPDHATESEAQKDRQTRVVVVDDHAIVRQGIANIINSDASLLVVAQASDGFEALQLMEMYLPDVILVDLNMPGMSGVELTREIRSRWLETVIIGLSVQDDTATARSMLDAGADAFLSKTDDADHFISTILALMDQ